MSAQDKTQEILSRLADLETKEAENRRIQKDLERDVFKLQKENFGFEKEILKSQREKETMESRLVDLEKKTEEIEHLRTKNGQLERENRQTTDRLVAIEKIVMGMETDLEQVVEVRENFLNRLTNLEDQTHVKESSDRINDMQSVVNRLRQEMTNVTSSHKTLSEKVVNRLQQEMTNVTSSHETLLEKVETLTRQQNSTDSAVGAHLERFVNDSRQIRQAVTEQLDDAKKQVDSSIKKSEKQMEEKMTTLATVILQKIDTCQTHLNDSCHMMENNVKKVTIEVKEGRESSERDLNGLRQEMEEKIETVKNETNQINNVQDTIRQSISRAALEPTGGLVTGNYVKMDKCVRSIGVPGMVDRATGCLVPKRRGFYFVGLQVVQEGDGEIKVNLKWDGDGGHTMVWTVRNYDVQSGLYVGVMEENEKHWLEAYRLKGEARIKWCRVYCWFLSPC